MKATDDPVIIHNTVKARQKVVWLALTEVERMREWYFSSLPAFNPVPGFEVTFDVRSGRRTFTHVWTVTDVETGSSIAYRWRYKDYPGDSTVRFDLSGRNSGTHIALRHTPHETFPQDVPEFQREACVQGWDYFIKTALQDYVESDERTAD